MILDCFLVELTLLDQLQNRADILASSVGLLSVTVDSVPVLFVVVHVGQLLNLGALTRRDGQKVKELFHDSVSGQRLIDFIHQGVWRHLKPLFNDESVRDLFRRHDLFVVHVVLFIRDCAVADSNDRTAYKDGHDEEHQGEDVQHHVSLRFIPSIHDHKVDRWYRNHEDHGRNHPEHQQQPTAARKMASIDRQLLA